MEMPVSVFASPPQAKSPQSSPFQNNIPFKTFCACRHPGVALLCNKNICIMPADYLYNSLLTQGPISHTQSLLKSLQMYAFT